MTSFATTRVEMRERPELKDGLTDLEVELLGVLRQAAGFAADMGFADYRYKHLQPTIDKVEKIRAEAQHQVWKTVK